MYVTNERLLFDFKYYWESRCRLGAPQPYVPSDSMIELLLAEITWLEGERMISMHRGQTPDFTTIETFLSVESDDENSEEISRNQL